MPVLYANLFSGSPFVKAIGLTLVHSLWLGLLVSILAGLVLLCTRHTKPAVRYNLLVFLFFCFTVALVYIFIQEKQQASVRVTTEMAAIKTVIPVAGNSIQQAAVPYTNHITAETVAEKIMRFVNENAAILALVWMIFFCLRFGVIIFNLYNLQKNSYRNTIAPPEYWSNRLQEMARRLGFKKRIQFRLSVTLQSPAVTGFLKPLLLLPAAVLTQLPPAQVEAILLHELAHIKRKDFFINLLQYIIEGVLFFNPAVYWLSSLIRDERENCCDEMAVNETGNKKEFIHALISTCELYTTPATPVLAFAGRKHSLLNRVERIIYNKNKTLTMKERIVLTAGLTVFLLFIVFAGLGQQRKDTIISNGQVLVGNRVNQTDLLTAKKSPMKEGVIIEGNTVTYIGDGFKIETNGDNDEITALWYNGKQIPKKEIKNYAARTASVIKQQREIFEKQVENLTPTNTQQGDRSPSDTADRPDTPDAGNGGNNEVDNASGIKITAEMRKEGYKLTQGNTVRYFIREYEVVTAGDKKLTALYINGAKVPDEKLSGYTELAGQLIDEVQNAINKRVSQWYKRVKNYVQ